VPYVYAYDHRHDLDPAAITLLLGGKAANIATMAVDLGLPVPPAFTITTEACKAYLAGGWPAGLDGEIRAHMTRLEAAVGRRFGDTADPLLVSVRSGAPRSMPGMMDTILNLGLNHATEAGLAAASGDPAFARNCHGRFHAIYRSVVGVEAVPADPWEQLRGAVEAVFNSWNSDRARAYREVEAISGDLGTGVTVQAMVFGNRGSDSGTGVLFTRNPATGERALYGDVMFEAQGEDVVAGTHDTEPVTCLDTRMPAVAAELRRYADVLEHHYRDCCDIEFTIERGRLWMLQVRVGKRTPQAAVRMAAEMAEDPAFQLTREEAVHRVLAYLADPPKSVVGRADAGTPLARGLGASPGLVSGEVRLTPEDAVAAADAGRDVILVRAETSPDDVHGMQRSCGILTSTGGFASHAAVVARGWGIPAVVGASDVIVGDGMVTIGGHELGMGSVISIDGSSGEIFAGVASGVEAVVPDAKVLLGWARELGIDIPIAAGDEATSGSHEATTGPVAAIPVPGSAGTGLVAAGPDDALRALLIKGYCLPPALATALGCGAEQATALIERLVATGQAEPGAGSFRLTETGRAAAAVLLAADAAAWGVDRATAALDDFIALDHRMKDIVTSWQMKGEGVFNDHADAEYDAAVLARLGGLHVDVEAWLEPLTVGLPRLARYGVRLGAAAAAAAAGDGKFIASPRVDSYHGVWFEFHEDLIGLAGRTRADEVAAGRA
jgi:pyruvate, orthophosphate dikinase